VVPSAFEKFQQLYVEVKQTHLMFNNCSTSGEAARTIDFPSIAFSIGSDYARLTYITNTLKMSKLHHLFYKKKKKIY